MNANEIVRKFEKIGARAAAFERDPSPTFDVRTDKHGEYFLLGLDTRFGVDVVDVRADLRHLLILSREPGENRRRVLCGHDERHWFVAGVPDDRGVSNVRTAMEALKPAPVRAEQSRTGLRERDRITRKNAAFLRQGEWFFLPRPSAVFDRKLVVRNEPIVRTGGGKPHWIDEVVRSGGEDVYLAPNGAEVISGEEYARLDDARRRAMQFWRRMRRNASVFARGRVRHPDHATIVLPFWHEVLMNEEHRAPGRESVVFLD